MHALFYSRIRSRKSNSQVQTWDSLRTFLRILNIHRNVYIGVQPCTYMRRYYTLRFTAFLPQKYNPLLVPSLVGSFKTKSGGQNAQLRFYAYQPAFCWVTPINNIYLDGASLYFTVKRVARLGYLRFICCFSFSATCRYIHTYTAPFVIFRIRTIEFEFYSVWLRAFFFFGIDRALWVLDASTFSSRAMIPWLLFLLFAVLFATTMTVF